MAAGFGSFGGRNNKGIVSGRGTGNAFIRGGYQYF